MGVHGGKVARDAGESNNSAIAERPDQPRQGWRAGCPATGVTDAGVGCSGWFDCLFFTCQIEKAW
jgi:hypothetical protein